MIEVLWNYKFIVLFYIFIVAFFYLHRKRVEVQAKFIFLYRTKWGLRWMDKVAERYREWIILAGYIGIGLGFVGLIFISFILIKNMVDLLTNPEAIAGVQPVLPGIEVPGLGVLPFADWIIAIFLIALVHEFSHGVVARAHRITVKNTGFVLFGPLLGAFVEPDEIKLRKQQDMVQYSILAAGSASNILLAIIAGVLALLIIQPLHQEMIIPTGFTFSSLMEDYPAAQAGLQPGMIITSIEDKQTGNFADFAKELQKHSPGDTVQITARSEITISSPREYQPTNDLPTDNQHQEYLLVLAAAPDDPQQPYLGITTIKNTFDPKPAFSQGAGKILFIALGWLLGFLGWLALLSSGIGIFNLLPLPIVDGGRMAQVFLHKLKGPEKGERRYRQIGFFFLMILVLNLLFWLWDVLF